MSHKYLFIRQCCDEKIKCAFFILTACSCSNPATGLAGVFVALLSLMYNRQSLTSFDQQRYSSAQHHQPIINTTTTTTTDTTTTTTTDATATAAPASTDVSNDVMVVDAGEGEGHVEGEADGQEAATNEKTALGSRDMGRQQISTLTRNYDDESSAGHGPFTLHSKNIQIFIC